MHSNHTFFNFCKKIFLSIFNLSQFSLENFQNSIKYVVFNIFIIITKKSLIFFKLFNILIPPSPSPSFK